VTAEAVAAFWAERREEDAALPLQTSPRGRSERRPSTPTSCAALVLAGTKTGTASTVWEYEDSGEPMPVVGELSIILDGSAAPRAVIRTTALEVAPFDQVDAEHAYSRVRAIAPWSTGARRTSATGDVTDLAARVRLDMPVLCERFELDLAAPA
jgi:uncharacterized protein YhfF